MMIIQPSTYIMKNLWNFNKSNRTTDVIVITLGILSLEFLKIL